MGVEIIFQYFPNLTELQKKQFNLLWELYVDWNSKINVVSRKDIDNLYTHHVLHSLGIAKVLSFEPNTSILDVGTGGGFPGIPLAIMFPDANFHLIDSIGKKITVVKEIVQSLELTNVSAKAARAENVKDKYDFVVSRAVTNLPKFMQWVNGKIARKGFNSLPNGVLYLKGGDVAQELAETKGKIQLFELNQYFNESFFESKKVVHVQTKSMGSRITVKK